MIELFQFIRSVETSGNKVKYYSVTKTFLTFHCLNKLFLWSQKFRKFSAFSLKFQKFFLIIRTFFSHTRSEQFWKQNTIFFLCGKTLAFLVYSWFVISSKWTWFVHGNLLILKFFQQIDLVANGEKGTQNKHMVVNTEWGAFGNQA